MRRLDNTHIRLLRVFVALAEAGSFADAQITLNLAQSTLSSHIAALERFLGGPVCVRGRRGFRLTPLGEATYTAARRLFADIETFQQSVGKYYGQLIGRLRVGIVDGVVSSAHLGLQSAIGRYMAHAESVFIDLELGTPQHLEQAVADGRRDIVIGPFSQEAPGVVYLPLHQELNGLYCGRSHPLFDLPSEKIDRAAIEQSLFSARSYRQLDDLYRVDHPRASGCVAHMEAQVMMILSGRFIGFLPRYFGDQWADKGMMRALKPEIYEYTSGHFIAYRKRDADNQVIRVFIDELRDQADSAA